MVNRNLKSSETLEALKFAKALFEETMPAEVLNWNAVSNNQYMLSAEGCLTIDTMSIVRASESKQMPVADQLRLGHVACRASRTNRAGIRYR